MALKTSQTLSPPTAIRLLAILALSLLLGACAGPQALQSSYVKYSDSFATAANQQLLLNLARVRNGHPPHFLQMGGVTAQFKFNAGVSASTQDFNPGRIADTVGLSLTAAENPTFQFTPLSGAAYSELLLTPIHTDVMHSLVVQNMPIPLVMRLMVDKITLQYENGVKAKFRNLYRSGNPDNYADFLRLVAHLMELKEADLLDFKKSGNSISFKLSKDTQHHLAEVSKNNPNYRLKTFNPATAEGIAEVHFITRSFQTVLFQAATEGLLFEQLSEAYLAGIPQRLRKPVIEIDANPAYTAAPSAEIEYAGKNYVISDKPGSFDNRYAFAVMQFLMSQVQLDPSKLPAPQMIQVQ